MKVRELSKGVYALISDIGDLKGDSNFGIITGNRGTALIDADIRRWEEITQLIDSVTDQPVRYLINTHHHFDHTSANSILEKKGVCIIASKASRSILAETGTREFSEKIAQDTDLREKYKVHNLSLPDIMTEDRLYLDLGERLLEIMVIGHSHTPGDMVVYLAEEEILFAGDVLFNGCHPVTKNAMINNWINTLDSLRQMPIQLTVPGHGETSSGKTNLKTLQNYFEVLGSRIGDLKLQGFSIEQVEKQLDLPEFESWGKKEWLPASIRKIYEELK